MPRQIQPLVDRFWAKVEKRESGCWIWTGATSISRRSDERYGYIQEGVRGSKVWRVHRLALTWAKGPAPTPDHEAGHRCPGPGRPNTLCVNDAHLEWVTRDENERDKRREREPGEEG